VLIKRELSGYPLSEKLVIALNNQFKELESIELDPENFIREIFSDSHVMDYITFNKKLDEFKQKLVAGKDLDKVRINTYCPLYYFIQH